MQGSFPAEAEMKRPLPDVLLLLLVALCCCGVVCCVV
jgi:hypothetical protein